MTIQNFVSEHEVECSTNLVKEKDLEKISNKIGVQIGKELADYILTYGYLAYEYCELYGVNSMQFLESDMVKQTLHLHTCYPKTKDYIAIENQGDGNYCLVDKNDYVYDFDTELNTLSPISQKLYKYIFHRFKEV